MKKTHPIANDAPDNLAAFDNSLQQTLEQKIAALRGMSGTAQLKAILDEPAPEDFVQALPLADLCRLMEAADADSLLLALASPEQIRLILDLELWEDWSVSTEESLKWLGAVLDTGDRQAVRILAQLDQELLLVFLKKNMTVGGGLSDIINSEDLQLEWDHTFDEVFYLRFLDEEASPLILRMLELLYTEHHTLYRSLMLGVESELLSELEETAWQFRAGRLADEGLPAGTTAAELLATSRKGGE